MKKLIEQLELTLKQATAVRRATDHFIAASYLKAVADKTIQDVTECLIMAKQLDSATAPGNPTLTPAIPPAT